MFLFVFYDGRLRRTAARAIRASGTGVREQCCDWQDGLRCCKPFDFLIVDRSDTEIYLGIELKCLYNLI